MPTLTDVLARQGLTPADQALAEIEVPILAGPQRQGDVLIVPRPDLEPDDTDGLMAVPPEGIAVVYGEATGNTHLLQAEPGCEIRWMPYERRRGSVQLGLLVVPDGGTAWLIHTDEHGANGIGAGTYVLHGKRELADEIRSVAD